MPKVLPGRRPGGPLFGPGHRIPGPYTRDWPGGAGPDVGLPLSAPAAIDRTASDAPTLSDAATIDLVLQRTASDAPATSDAANVLLGDREAADTVTLSDAATRALAFTRSTADSPTLSDTATRTGNYAKTAADAVTLSDAATIPERPTTTISFAPTAAGVKNATAAPTVSLALAPVAVGNLGHSSATLIFTPVAAATKSVSGSASTTIVFNPTASGYSSESPWLPPTIPPGGGSEGGYTGPGGVTTAQIFYDGTDITEFVIFSSATFTSQANAGTGTCAFTVRDDDQDKVFVQGKRLLLKVNGLNCWAGYVTGASRSYGFAALDTTTPAEVTRLIKVDGVDINILFHKRIVFNQSRPTDTEGPRYGDDTNDITVIEDLTDRYLDLTDDDIDTHSMVQNIGTVNENDAWQGIQPTQDWANTMRSIVAMAGSIYYIDPDRRLVLSDVDTPDAPFSLTDNPTTATEVGFREAAWTFRGDSLANDVLVWGAGGGSTQVAFHREQDTTSIATYGRWQVGEFRSDMYKEASVQRRAESIVYGSPQSKRGGNEPLPAVAVTIFTPGIRVGMTVDIEFQSFGLTDTLPCRRQEISFPTPTDVKFKLLLSHELDPPFGLIDVYRIKMPNLGGLPNFDFDFDFGPGLQTAGWVTVDNFNVRTICDSYELLGNTDSDRSEERPWTVEGG